MSGLILYTIEGGARHIQLHADGKRYQAPIVKFRLRREATIKPSLTIQTVAKPRATAEESSVDQVVDNGQLIGQAKVLDCGLTRQRLPSSAGN